MQEKENKTLRLKTGAGMAPNSMQNLMNHSQIPQNIST